MGAFAAWSWRPQATVVHGSMIVDGEQRDYRLVLPRQIQDRRAHPKRTEHVDKRAEGFIPSVLPEHDVPVIFALHGAIDTVDEMAGYTELDRLAIEKGFLLVYLQGRMLNWPPFIPPENPGIYEPDVKFFNEMCDFVVREHGVDPQRIYLLGVSQGGAAANALTAMCSERIAATVVGCGWLPEPLGETPLQTVHKCPVLFLVGDRDRQVPPEYVRKGYDAFERAGHPVEFRMVEGFGHGWPRRENERVWEFLQGKILENATK
ncbi:alpha/beta hydrolase family esterase [Lacipirellula sp.]|uniref:alpha/beta hydrolase family esterase n=1 Tax=Lacipirellula sp. TaxID=2691419 RepID=UPI003D0B6166